MDQTFSDHNKHNCGKTVKKLEDVMANVDFSAISEMFAGGGMT
jgi:hypothetical protein